MYSLLLTLTLIFLSPAFGLVGNLDESELLPQSCKIVLSQAPQTEDGVHFIIPQTLCSATVIGEKTLLTTAHCFKGIPYESGEISCPGRRPVKLADVRMPENFTEPSDSDTGCQNLRNDIAVISAVSSLEVTPIRLPQSGAQIDALLEENPSCAVFGYGRDESGAAGGHAGRSVTLGEWHTRTDILTRAVNGEVVSRTETPVFEKKSPCGLRMMPGTFTDSEGIERSFTQKGDSGGGLVCTSEDGEKTLIGVTRGDSKNDGVPVGASLDLGMWLFKIRQWKMELEGTTRHTPETSNSH